MGTYLFEGTACRGWVTINSPLNITASGSTFTPTIPAMTRVRAQHEWHANNTRRRYKLEGTIKDSTGNYLHSHITGWSSVVANNTIEATIPAGNAYSINTSSLFSSKNPTAKTVSLYLETEGPTASYYESGTWEDERVDGYYLTKILTINVTLNAPPTFTATATSSAPYFANTSRYKVNLANLSAKYGGTISNAVLTVGSQTASRTTNGELSIALNTEGTFTPSVKVTDSRGQVTTVNLSAITVNTHTSPTISAETLSVAPYYTTGTTYTAETSNATAYNGTSISSISLAIGSQTVTRTTDDQLSISPNRAGTFTPTVTIVDSAGASSVVQLSSIQVAQYTSPSMNGISIQRTESSGKPNEEETSAVIGYQLTWIEDLGHIQKPKLYIDDSTTEATVTWYKSYNTTTSPYLSNPITNWTTVSSGDIVYAFISGAFPIANSYSISSVVSDDYATSAVLVMTLAQAFFTIDFLAGGKGIAFGQLATDEGFYCNMDAHFKDKANVMRALFDFVYPKGSYYETSDSSFNPNNAWGGTWVLETAGQVHVSAGTGYSVSGALSNTSDGGSKDAIVPYHRHGVSSVNISSSGGHSHTVARYANSGTAGTGYTWDTTSSSVKYGLYSVTGDGAHTHSVPAHDTNYAGSSGNTTNANMQPYIVVNRWHRIA